jgi:hypothetical protein
MTYFIKISFRKDFRIIFLADKIRFKRNYLKDREKAACDWLVLWKKWVMTLDRCGTMRQDEGKKVD